MSILIKDYLFGRFSLSYSTYLSIQNFEIVVNSSVQLTLLDKIELIRRSIAEKEKVLVAFSGGVDSSTLAALAVGLLGENAVAVTLNSPVFPNNELEYAKQTAIELGIKHIILDHNMLLDDRINNNDQDRCYYCKKLFVERLSSVASESGFGVIMEGTNASEINGRRPGLKAIKEAGSSVFTPYVEYNVSKDEVRQIASYLGLAVAKRPSNACLLSRLTYGTKVTPDILNAIESAEDHIRSFGISSLRVRVHDDIARIEVLPDDIPIVIEKRSLILSGLKEVGFSYVTLDLEGFRSGSMDEAL